MKTTLLAVSIALCMSNMTPVIAAEPPASAAHTAQTTTAATHTGRGKIVSVDSATGTVKITHDPIASLKWPKMTMDFKAHDAALLTDLKPGMKVDFELMKMDGAYHIMKITPTGAAGETHKHTHDSPATADAHHMPHGSTGHHDSSAGQPGDASKVNRTIKITALDIKYDKPEIAVKAGETVKFVVTNAGKLKHEFIIGNVQEQRQHAEMMKQMPGMVHEDANTLTLEPGETKSLVWQFTKTGALEIACHVPGHYEAGMRGKVTVTN